MLSGGGLLADWEAGHGAMSSRIRMRWVLAAGLLGAVLAPLGWVASDALERNNDFCNACHLDRNVPLHIDIRRDFDGRPPRTLASRHAQQTVSLRPDDPEMRCIECHGGVGLVGRSRIKLLAARDAVVWLVGLGREPDGMRHPLLDADCLQCHERFEVRRDPYGPPPFHATALHNSQLGTGCVTCHTAHDSDGRSDFYFLRPERVRERCAYCHSEFEH